MIVGPMFAGKSSAIQSIVKRHKAMKWPICVITHSIDTRYSEESLLVNHDQQSIPAIRTESLVQQMGTPSYIESRLVVVEEAQFFKDLVPFVQIAVDTHGKHVVVVGLDGDSERLPFGRLLDLIPLADRITKLTAFCTDCSDGTAAIFTYAHSRSEEASNIYVGGAETYSALCRNHYLARKAGILVTADSSVCSTRD